MRKIILILALSILLKFSFIFYFLFFTYPVKNDILFDVAIGDSSNKIFKNLGTNNIGLHPFIDGNIFRISQIFNKKLFFKAGEYSLKTEDNYFNIIKKIIAGDIYLRKFTVIEGETITTVINELNNNEFLIGNIEFTPREGSVLPETYFFKKGDHRNEVLKMMQENMTSFLADIWQKRDQDIPLKSMDELLILASIVEKESSLESEKDHIAGLFINRLRKRMKLQSCPTTIYAITMGKRKFNRPLLNKDLTIESIYNTYHIYGLPPTPICNPSMASIIAVSRPKDTNDLYFVSDGKGSHRFAKTYKEHIQNVRLLRNYEKKQKSQK